MEKHIILKESIEKIIATGIVLGEEIDITSAKMYKLFKDHLEYEKRKI